MDFLFCILILCLVILYSWHLFKLLNYLFHHNLLFRNDNNSCVAILFSQDIFGLFWLLIMWFPLTLFSISFLWKAFFTPAIKPFLYLLLFIFPFSLIVGSRAVAESTSKFNNQSTDLVVWSKVLQDNCVLIYRVYNGMELYNCFFLMLDVSLTLIYLYCAFLQESTNSAMCIFSLISSLIFITYFIMNALSKLTAHIKLNLSTEKSSLFPEWQIAVGIFLICCLSLAIIEYIKEMRVESAPSMWETISFIFASLSLPSIPIIIQLIQLASPLRKK